jgi:hypothetical protein
MCVSHTGVFQVEKNERLIFSTNFLQVMKSSINQIEKEKKMSTTRGVRCIRIYTIFVIVTGDDFKG